MQRFYQWQIKRRNEFYKRNFVTKRCRFMVIGGELGVGLDVLIYAATKSGKIYFSFLSLCRKLQRRTAIMAETIWINHIRTRIVYLTTTVNQVCFCRQSMKAIYLLKLPKKTEESLTRPLLDENWSSNQEKDVPDGGYGWVIVCVGFLLQFIAVGISESWSV